jgi:tetratricopeptide (TPR) repeat protein/predicted Ser/Thr protein kinase
VSAGGAGHVAEEQPETTGTALFRGGMIGRYIVLGLLGKGGMGVVYSAYDPELDRKVALKLLRVVPGRKGTDLDAKRLRLLREAKAIARLSHPSVVVVYDVGTYQDQVFIAMELVDGMTATRWRDTDKPSWRQVLDVFKAAGEGIAAAHAADLIHRDLKPDNVMVTRDGKVRVMDFGLARQLERMSEDNLTLAASPDGEEPTMPGMRPTEARLTNEGNVVGTPAYMPPEQYLGVTDERSDQFSFCVSLYECVYGTHPFEAKTSYGLTANVQAGRVHDAPPHTKVPLWLRKILLKGMRPRPEDRYKSMRELLEALARDPAIARRRWLMAGAVAASAVGLAIGVQRAADTKRAFCAAAPEKLATAWELPNEKQEGFKHGAVRKAFLATGKLYALDAIRGSTKLLDEYATKWANLYRDACEATHLRGEQSEELLDLRMSCLNERLAGLRALTNVFEGATGQVVEHAVEAAHALTPLDSCNDIRQLRSLIPPPDATVRARVEALRRELGEIKAVHDAGKYINAIARLEPIVAEARDLQYKPLEAEARTRLAVAHTEQGNNSQAEAMYKAALLNAIAARHDDLLAMISAALVWPVGFQDRFEEAAQWMHFAEAAIERTSGSKSIVYAWLLNNMGAVLYREGRFAESVEYQRRAVALKEQLLGAEDLDVAISLGNVALGLGALHEAEEALKMNDRALRVLRHTLGDAHVRVANELSNRGEILLTMGRYPEAVPVYEEARITWERELGVTDPSVAYALSGLGRALLGIGRLQEAVVHLERARQIRLERDRSDQRLAEVELALGKAYAGLHPDSPRATSLFRSALEKYQRVPHATAARTEIQQLLSSSGRLARPSK